MQRSWGPTGVARLIECLPLAYTEPWIQSLALNKLGVVAHTSKPRPLGGRGRRKRRGGHSHPGQYTLHDALTLNINLINK